MLTRRWWVVVLTLLVGAGTGWWFADQQPRLYTATTQVLVRPMPGEASSPRINLDTEAQLVTSARTADRARRLLDDPTLAPGLSAQVGVRVPPNTQVLEISFQSTTPERAQLGATAFAQAYLDQRTADAQAQIDDRVSALTERIAQLQADPQSDQPVPPQVITALATELALLEAEPVRVGEVISPADLPTSPDSPNVRLYTGSGLLIGLLLGLSAVGLIHRWDSRVLRAAGLPDGLAARVLLELPTRPPPVVAGPATPTGRQFSRLRNILRARADDSPTGGEPVVWLICGASAGPAAGLATANLAAAVARAGGQVAVVVTDPASAGLPALGLDRAHRAAGLPEVFDREVSATEALVAAPAAPGVSVLLPGPTLTAELPVPELAEAVSRLGSVATHVLIETPPATRTVDAQTVSALASAVLLVVQRGRTRAVEIRTVVHDLTQVGSPLAGVLLLPGPRRPVRSPRTAGSPRAAGPPPSTPAPDPPPSAYRGVAAVPLDAPAPADSDIAPVRTASRPAPANFLRHRGDGR